MRAFRNRLKKGRGLTIPEATDDLVAGRQRVLWLVQRAERATALFTRALATGSRRARVSLFPKRRTTSSQIASTFLWSVQFAKQRRHFTHEGLRNRLKKERGLAIPEATDHFVADRQRVLRPVQRVECRSFVCEGPGNRLKKGRGLTIPEATDHFVADRQRVLRPIQSAERGSFVQQDPGQRLKKGRGLAIPEATNYFIVDLDHVLWSVQREERGPFVRESAGHWLKKGRDLAIPEATNYFIADR